MLGILPIHAMTAWLIHAMTAWLFVGKMCAHPIHMDEDDRAYCHCSANVREFTEMELKALATKTAVDYYDPVQQILQQERRKLIEEIYAALYATNLETSSSSSAQHPN